MVFKKIAFQVGEGLNAELAQLQHTKTIEKEKLEAESKIISDRSKDMMQGHIKSNSQYIDLDKLFSFARENNDFYTKDNVKGCYSNRDKTLEVYRNKVVINVISDENVAKGLRLAHEQFGNNLEIIGSQDFIDKAIDRLANNLLFKNVQLYNPEHQKLLDKARELRQDIKHNQTGELSAVEQAKQLLASKNQSKIEKAEFPDYKVEKMSATEQARLHLAGLRIKPIKEAAKDLVNKNEEKLEHTQAHKQSRGLTFSR